MTSVYTTGGIEQSLFLNIIKIFYFVVAMVVLLVIAGKLWENICDVPNDNGEKLERVSCGYSNGLMILYGISLIPIIMISPYAYAKADDYSFGYHSHIAWESSRSLIEVFKAAFVMIKEAYFGWQGTHTSIFMMSLHPAVFNEKLYRIVPLFFIALITLSSYFFLKVIFVEIYQTDFKKIKAVIWAYIILVIQCIPVKQSAFIWYNGAVHYILSHSMLLFAVAFTCRFMKKGGWINYSGAAICFWYVGGGNYVTAISTLFITICSLIYIAIKRKLKKLYPIVTIIFIFIVSLTINIIAPGNFQRLGNSNGKGLVESFYLAFVYAGKYMLGNWIDWCVIAFILFTQTSHLNKCLCTLKIQ